MKAPNEAHRSQKQKRILENKQIGDGVSFQSGFVQKLSNVKVVKDAK